MPTPPPVSAGIGPDEAPGVLRYATMEAARRGATLRLVHAYTVPPATVGAMYGYDFPASFREAGQQLLDRSAAIVSHLEPDVRVEQVLVRGTPARTMEDESRLAQLVVVGGDTDKPLLMRLYEGRTASHLARNAHCPAVIVPADWSATPVGGDVLVLVDHHQPPDEATIDFAAAHARRLRCEVIVVDIGPRARQVVHDAAATDESGLVVVGRDSHPGRSHLAHLLDAPTSCPIAVVPPSAPSVRRT
ncbi:hypothetical protein GEV27_01875 [Aeromicrobium sp. S22]|uniref:universal stress protein n=1 Tax=Aeromicrobium sp. S22 TaxID=2662029 RepID=UPI00129D48E9|nr:universal stress protein [Aeromicrobium sp. S22]MRK00260.1 hypothetical protein [Aeromicrobium sp. S22]